MIIKLLLLLVLILINGIFSGSEIAYLSIDKIKLSEDKKKNKNAKLAYKLTRDINKFLATIQVVITLAGFMASAFAAETFTSIIISCFNFENIQLMEPIIMVVITFFISYLTLVFGELVPKRIGLSNPNKIAYFMAKPLIIARFIFNPFVSILTKTVTIICKIFKIKDRFDEELTEERIKKSIILGRDVGVLEVNESDILMKVFEFNDITVEQAMTKKEEIVYIDINESQDSIINKFKKYKFTRYPVVENKKLVGILNIKDLIINHELSIEKMMREPIYVKSNDKIDDVFIHMKEKNIGMMVIKDKGIITLEDIIEELLGSIQDEFN